MNGGSFGAPGAAEGGGSCSITNCFLHFLDKQARNENTHNAHTVLVCMFAFMQRTSDWKIQTITYLAILTKVSQAMSRTWWRWQQKHVRRLLPILAQRKSTQTRNRTHPGVCFLHEFKKFVDDCLQKSAVSPFQFGTAEPRSGQVQDNNQPPMCKEEARILADHIHNVTCNNLRAVIALLSNISSFLQSVGQKSRKWITQHDESVPLCYSCRVFSRTAQANLWLLPPRSAAGRKFGFICNS